MFFVESKYLCAENSYWLDHYPFISISGTSLLIKNYVTSHIENHGKAVLLPSHNNHFGHFVLDDLPLLNYSFCYYPNQPTIPFPYNWIKGIHRELSQYQNKTSSSKCNIPSCQCSYKHSIVYKLKTINYTYSSNLALNSFLSRSLLWNKPSNGSVQSKKSCFLIRGSGHSSRVYNLSELIDYCKSNTITLIDPSKFSMNELSSLLQSFSIILAESGHHNFSCLLLHQVPRKLFRYALNACFTNLMMQCC